MVIAGEVSGDMHAAALIRGLRARDPELNFWGIGGPEMRAAGVETLVDVSEMASMGLAEVLRRYPFFRRVFYRMLDEAAFRKPDAVLLVDYPGFNLRLAKKLNVRAASTKIIYYISPQVWAWKSGRIADMEACIDRLMVIFPFEKALFANCDLRVSYVGHPLVEETRKALEAPTMALPWPEGVRRLALLPGSRRQEIDRIYPLLLDLVDRLPDVSVMVAAASDALADQLCEKGGIRRMEVVVGQTREILRQADVALVTSGTATFEACLMHCPAVIVYRTSWLTYAVGKRVVKLPHIGMANIVAGKEICPEFVQHEATAENIEPVLRRLLDDPSAREKMISDMQEVCRGLETHQEIEDAAAVVLSELE